jgi:zinc transporter ZupT
MLWINALILFLSSFLTGLVVFVKPVIKPIYFTLSLAFSGAYLFTLTLTHILPELFAEAVTPFHIGIFVVLGFLMQVLLEFFTEGIEHGHLHHHHLNANTMLVALCVHALLEGTLLSHPSHQHENGETNTLLFGIVIHKVPEAFAFAAVLLAQMKQKRRMLPLLLIFALSSPIGVLSSNFINMETVVSKQVTDILFAIVAGNFLHISTTIFFESNPQHQFNGKRLICILGGVLVAILAEGLL